jgi:hypothetical protein
MFAMTGWRGRLAPGCRVAGVGRDRNLLEHQAADHDQRD